MRSPDPSDAVIDCPVPSSWHGESLLSLVNNGVQSGASWIDSVRAACCVKYGHEQYWLMHRRERELTGWHAVFSEVCDSIKLRSTSRRILAVGINDGMDIEEFGSSFVTGVDPCLPALRRAALSFPQHSFHPLLAEELPFEDASFDGYLALRVVNSSSVNLPAMLREMVRLLVPAAPFVFSIANGHWEGATFVRGTLRDGQLYPDAPDRVTSELANRLAAHGCNFTLRPHVGEDFLFGWTAGCK